VRHSAVVLSPGHARLLGAEPGSPGLQILRRYLTGRDEPMELSLGIQPGSLQSPTMRFHKASKGADAFHPPASLPGSA
jgi:DNA-binding GntR family transcriptional regulator